VRQQLTLALSSVAIGVVGCLLMVEIALRFLPVFDGVYLQAVDKDRPVARLQPNRPLTYSVGWRLARATQNRVNNDGFVHDDEYRPEEQRPTAAIIGDSYVEALMLPHAETMQGLLGKEAGAAGRVYSFGISGAPMSQYLIWAQHARQRYAADALVFVIVATDFDESLLKYRMRTGFHYFDGDLQQCSLKLTRLDHQPNRLRPLLQHSALLQYLVFNLGLLEGERRQAWLRRFAASGASDASADARTLEATTRDRRAKSSPDTRTSDSLCAIRTFFHLLPELVDLAPERILFVLDGLRAYTATARAAAEQGYFAQMRQHFLIEATTRGYQVIDTDPLFEKQGESDESGFEMPQDVHWNANAHALVAEQIMKSPLFRNLFPQP
jgi:hypothetical protein